MTDSSTFGRNRQSIVEIEQELHDIFREHPQCYVNADDEPVLPAKYLPDVFETYRQEYGLELLATDEMNTFLHLVETSPGLEATPQTILALVAMRTSGSPQSSPSPESSGDDWERGRGDERDAGRHSRSSSNGSAGTYYQPSSSSRPPSRPPSRGGPVPKTPVSKESPFDVQKRQRSTPLGATAPSSWTKRPVAPSRRKSDAGSHSRSASDSEVRSLPSGRTPGRKRTPSNPTSPGDSAFSPQSSLSGISSPPMVSPPSRPHSRAQSQPQSHFSGFNSYDSYDEDPTSPPRRSPPDLDLSNSMYDSFDATITSLPMPRHASDSDSDEDESALGLVYDRSAASSTVSMEPSERLEALQRINGDLGKKLFDAERTLQRKLADHEAELEEMEARLEEARTELSAAKREEKELRSKERTNLVQISVLETEIAKVQKSLDTSRSSYTSLQKQYAEQLSEAEDLRNSIRRKDDELKESREGMALQSLENSKLAKEHDAFEDRFALLEQELAIAQQAQASLDEQKQENLMLKETIDRMRFDMDELRSGLTSNTVGAGSGSSSAQNSVSKSLGAELLSKMRDGGGWMDEEEEEEEPSTTLKDLQIEVADEDTEGEDVIQTIITRKKRRGASKANKMEPVTIEDNREYSNAYTQYDGALFAVSSTTQTDPEPKVLTASFSMQTEDTPMATSEIQTDPPIPKPMAHMEIQTEAVDEEASRSPSPADEEALASSSSTVQPPTPKAKPTPLDLLNPTTPTDSPPAYNQVTKEPLFHDLEHVLDTDDLSFSHVSDPQTRRDLRIAAETLKKWHKGMHIPLQPSGTVSAETAEEWRALKEELGIDCLVIDKAVEGAPRPSKDSARRRSRFYNIYNTYVYPGGEGGPVSLGGVASHALVCVGASAMVLFAMSPFLAHHYAVPGGPTYYDRAAWTSFNTMRPGGEGFPNDGTTAVWNLLGRLGFGAARIARGWPT
ncbi:hypothetical protein FA95DRAFT_1654138 [Auriscalpium vulgare]|uniref:Uncharacterized protein n=1 Tax=Auriscalpium vulgare TaxID=40419 RepID=A0ACB8R6U1_9AGAM|nr:hypothetical protein FA95DRAFT_1654138 [Auriscalpium vulgare]